MRTLVHAAGFAVLVLALGCGDRPRSRVYGKVTYQGKPLVGAIVTFFGPDNSVHTGDARAEGRYEVAGLPRGSCRVSVQMPTAKPATPAPRGDKMGGRSANLAPEAPATSVELPAKYGAPDSSGLTVELKDADQEYDIPLK